MLDTIYLFLFRGFAFFVKTTPYWALSPMCRFLAFCGEIILKKHSKIVKTNLDFAFGDAMSDKEKREIVSDTFKNLFFYLADFVRNLKADKEKLLQNVTFMRGEILQKLLDENKKIVFITAHYGNWELLPKAITAHFAIKMAVVGRELDSKSLNEYVEESRNALGVSLINKHGAMRKLVKALKDGNTVGVLVDQNTADDEGLIIDFFGKEARQTHVASILARRFDAAVLPVFIVSDDRKNFRVEFYEPIYPAKTSDSDKDILECTQAQSNAIEEQIKKKPNEWFWLHKRWKNRYEGIYK